MEQSRANVGARCASGVPATSWLRASAQGAPGSGGPSLPPTGVGVSCISQRREPPQEPLSPGAPLSSVRSVSAGGGETGVCGAAPEQTRVFVSGKPAPPPPRLCCAASASAPLAPARGPSFPELASHQGPTPGPAHFCCPCAGSRCHSYPRT